MRLWLAAAAHLLGLAREASRPEAVAGNLGQMHMLGQMQAAHQPSKIAALRAAQIGHLLAKPLAYLTLKAKAVAHRQGVILVSWWFTCQPTYEDALAMAIAFCVLNPFSKSVR